MTDDTLLRHYQNILYELRKFTVFPYQKSFNNTNKLKNSEPIDPHIMHWIDAVALSNARINRKLEHTLPQLYEAILEIIDPDILLAIPSMAIAQFQFDNTKLSANNTLKPNIRLHSEIIDNMPCYFSTRYVVHLLPFTVKAAKFLEQSASSSFNTTIENNAAILCITLAMNGYGNRLCEKPIRFYINAMPSIAYCLYDLLFQHTTRIIIKNNDLPTNTIVLTNNIIKPVGFTEDENMIPYFKEHITRTHLIKEFFIFPEKFLFFDVDLTTLYNTPDSNILFDKANTIEINFYFNKFANILENKVNQHCFLLNCTPIINLFEQVAEPIYWNHYHLEYPIIPNTSHLSESIEVYAVKDVYLLDAEKTITPIFPFYKNKQTIPYPHYHILRKTNTHTPMDKTNFFLCVSNLDLTMMEKGRGIFYVNVLCTNRVLPKQLSCGLDAIQLQVSDTQLSYLDKVVLLTPMTSYQAGISKNEVDWYYLSQFSLKHLNIISGREGLSRLKSLIKLYSRCENTQLTILSGLLEISSRSSIQIAPKRRRLTDAIGYGTEIELLVDHTKFLNHSLYLFGYILNYFFALYTSQALFSQLRIKTQQGELIIFEAKQGEKSVMF